MKYVLIIALFLCGAQQDAAQTSLIDSLKNELVDAVDTNRVDILCILARKYAQTKTEEALEYGTEGILLAQQLNYAAGQVMCESQLATAYYSQGQYQLAADYTRKIMAYYEQNGQTKFYLQSMVLLGSIVDNLGELNEALRIHQESFELAQSIGYTRLYAYAQNNIGNVYLKKAAYNQAIAAYQKAIAFNEEKSPNRQLANTYRNIGIAYNRKGDYEVSLNYFLKAQHIIDQFEQPRWSN